MSVIARRLSLQLEGQTLEYLLSFGRRKTLGLRIDAQGLRVGAPLGTPIARIEDFLRQHGRWIFEKLAAQAARPQPAAALALVEGATIPYLGQDWTLHLLGGNNQGLWRDGARSIELRLRPGADPRPVLLRSFQRRALAHFSGRVAHFCARLGVPLPPVGLTNARTRWGSCSSRSGIRLHWRLAHLAPALIDYVVAHEVAHLLEMNHSPRFWSVVESVYPDFKAARAALRGAGAGLPLI